MRVLAMRGAHVIGTGRTIEQAREACAGVQGTTTPVVLELTDAFQSVVDCANQIRKLSRGIDVRHAQRRHRDGRFEQVNGLEKQFVANHLGHFILANRLMDRVRAASQGRVVTVGSGSHNDAPAGGPVRQLAGKGWEDKAYGHSKLANGLSRWSFQGDWPEHAPLPTA